MMVKVAVVARTSAAKVAAVMSALARALARAAAARAAVARAGAAMAAVSRAAAAVAAVARATAAMAAVARAVARAPWAVGCSAQKACAQGRRGLKARRRAPQAGRGHARRLRLLLLEQLPPSWRATRPG